MVREMVFRSTAEALANPPDERALLTAALDTERQAADLERQARGGRAG
jgi:hypothetical protein